ncbi:hypothetical protein [uncultured Desulfobacter sp.]|uniref:hypothetical protein n=1 Tax=uncultured Desulfobacter sp. TaxID=240139 RepID=UPI0029F4F0C9|nr:hypothetical protein [uncultured Desulfobacter sp.]
MVKKMKSLCVFFCGFVVLSLILLQMPAPCHAFDIEIDVSPNVLNIQSNSTIVTVHTDIDYNLVVGASVFLNDVAIDWWKSDDRGNFVAKFDSDEIKALPGLITGNYNTLTLTGYTTDDEAFIGVQEIMVIDNIPVGRRD